MDYESFNTLPLYGIDMAETDNPIEEGNTYYNNTIDMYVHINELFVDEAGETQVRARQYTDYPTRAHNAAVDTDGVCYKLSLHIDDIRDRILSGELELA
jgi:hypothetical protein